VEVIEECNMSDSSSRSADRLLEQYALAWAREAATAANLAGVTTNDELYALLAARVSDPQETFGTPEDRFRAKFDPATLPRGPAVFEVGKRIFRRSAAALHSFLCDPTEEDKQLQEKIKAALVSKDTSSIAIIAGGLMAIFGMGAASAAVVAALLVRIIVASTIEVLCQVWDEQIKTAISGA
jgi:hypothetical protein